MRNYKKTSECPPPLQKIIRISNLLSKEIEDRLFFDRMTRFFNDGMKSVPKAENLEAVFKNIVGNEELFDHFNVYEPGRFFFPDATARLHETISARGFLRWIGDQNKKQVSKKFIAHEKAHLLAHGFLSESGSPFIRSTFVTDGNGNIRPMLTEFAQVFLDYDVPFVRIRLCPICDEIFWARRLDAKTCGKKSCAEKLSKQTARAQKFDKVLHLKKRKEAEEAKLEKMRAGLSDGNGLLAIQQQKIEELKRQIREVSDDAL